MVGWARCSAKPFGQNISCILRKYSSKAAILRNWIWWALNGSHLATSSLIPHKTWATLWPGCSPLVCTALRIATARYLRYSAVSCWNVASATCWTVASVAQNVARSCLKRLILSFKSQVNSLSSKKPFLLTQLGVSLKELIWSPVQLTLIKRH